MKIKKFEYFVGDFETTVYEGQEYTEVWASGIVKMYTEDVKIFHSIEDTFEYLCNYRGNVCVFYHNLKFDGSFWIPFLLQKKKFKQAYIKYKVGDKQVYEWKPDKNMFNGEFKYSISDRGQWYSIIIKVNNKYIEIRDSLKLLPFSVKKIGKSFGTKHKKLDMEYEGYRYAGCEITEEEKKYLANDLLVVKEALEIMFNDGHNSLTIGSCCLKEFKRLYDKVDYTTFFPNLYEIPLTKDYGASNVGEYIRRSYKGGWCYLVKGKEGKVYHNGLTADVNSLYPSMMHSSSGNAYPIGKPKFWKGNMIPDEAIKPDKYFFIRIKTRFYLKEGRLPFIQIKNSFLYLGNECLTTSDIYNSDDEKYYQYIEMPDGKIEDTSVTLTLTQSDYYLLVKHYELVDFEILDGCFFYSETGIFDEYINKYAEIKMHSTGAIRELAKLFLNNLYGKEASSPDSSFKVAYEKDNKVIGFIPVKEDKKQPGYIAIGSAITSYARCFTITAAQNNYYGVDKPGFIYADTDSIHCDLPPEKIKSIQIDKVKFSHWKLESYWDEATFTRQKTYIEHITHEDGEKIEDPYYSVRCAGMPEKSKNIFIDRVKEGEAKLTDFNVGLKLEGKLTPKRIIGGMILVNSTYEMR